MEKNGKVTYTILVALLILASILRLIHPLDIPYTNDEFNALYRTHFNSFSELIAKGVIIDAHPAGVQVFLYYWTKLFGYSEIVVKLPFIICGILSVLYTFYIGKEWFNATVGLVCATFIATLQYTVMYSQIARPYASGLFFALAMVYYWNKVIFKPQEHSNRNGALYILFSTLCAYNHYFSLLVAAMVGFTGLFFVQKRYTWKYMAEGILIFILYIPHLRIFLYQFRVGGLEKILSKPKNNFISEYLQYVFHFSLYIYICVIGLTLWGIISVIRNKPRFSPYLMISLCWFLIPFLTGFFYSRCVSPVLQYSVLIFSFPFLLFFLLGWLPDLSGKLKAVLVIFICLLNITSLVYQRKYYSIFYTSRYEQIVRLTDSVNKSLGSDSCISIIQSNAIMPESFYVRKYKVDTTSFIYLHDSIKTQRLVHLIEQQKKNYLTFGCLASPDPNDVAIFLNYYPYLIKQCNFYAGNFYLFSRYADKGKSPYIYKSVNDFEQPHEFWDTSNATYVTDSIFFAGNHSYKMDSLHEWGPAFTCTLNKMLSNNRNFINVSIELLPLESLNDVLIVSTFESEGKVIDWRATPVSSFIVAGKNKKWQKAYHSIQLSDIDLDYPNVIAKIFIWNREKKNFYMDNFEIQTIPGNPIIYSFFQKI